MTSDKSLEEWLTEYHERKRNDPRSTQELVHIALTADDEDSASEAISVLWYRTSHDVVEIAGRLAESDDPDSRNVAARILGRGGIDDSAFPAETAEILLRMLQKERVPDVLNTICTCLGFRRETQAIPLLVDLKEHPMATVRLGIVHGLACQKDDLSISTLIELSQDEDDEVRDWATFGLGTMIDSDTPTIRQALVARLTDSDRDTRGEAMVGLARRKDEQVIEPLIAEIYSDDVGSLALDAAFELADPRLCPALLALKAEIGEDSELESALQSCSCENQ